MSLHDRDPEAKLPGPRCSLCAAWNQFTPDDLAVLRKWLDDPRYMPDEIAGYLAADGFPRIARNAIKAHRAGACPTQARHAV